jgi:hypothetical protein
VPYRTVWAEYSITNVLSTPVATVDRCGQFMLLTESLVRLGMTYSGHLDT